MTEPQPKAQVEVVDALPTVLAYSRALARSPEELDALLDKHARLGSQRDTEEPRIHPLTRLDIGLHRSIGEL